MKKILAVDDHREILEIIKIKLSKHDYVVETISDPTIVLEKIKTFKPDLVLLDIMMPKITGFELLEAIRKDKKFKNTKVVFLTAKDMDFAKEKARELNADGFIAKPFSPKELLKFIDELLNQGE